MYTKKQRLAALIGVILLALLYLVTLVCAIFNFDGTGVLFQSCLFATIALPILIWVYIWMFGKMTGKKTIADIDMQQDMDNEVQGENDPGTAANTITISKGSTIRNKKTK